MTVRDIDIEIYARVWQSKYIGAYQLLQVDYKFTIRSYLINAKEMEEGRIDFLV